jgi:hypothetical protein
MFAVAYATGYYWNQWKEFDGELFVAAYSSYGTGILRYDATTGMFAVAYATGYYWSNWFKVAGKIFIGSSGYASGLLSLDTSTMTFSVAYSTSACWANTYVVGTKVFVSSTSTNAPVLRVNEDTGVITVVYSTNAVYNEFKELGTMTVISHKTGAGAVMLKDDGTATNVTYYSYGGNFKWLELPGISNYAFASPTYSNSSSYGGFYQFNIPGRSVTRLTDYGVNYDVLYEYANYILVGPASGTSTSGRYYAINKLTATAISTYIQGYGKPFVQEFQGKKMFSSADGSNAITGMTFVLDNATQAFGYNSGNAWRVFLDANDVIYMSSKLTQGILRVVGSYVNMIYSPGYDWGSPVEYEGELYVSASGVNETNSAGLLRLNTVSGKFEKVYAHGFDFRMIPMTGGDHWVSESYLHVYPVVSTGFQLDGYQSGPLMIGYTVNKHGIIQLTNDAVKQAFVSTHEMPDALVYMEGDADDYYIFSKGSLIYSV